MAVEATVVDGWVDAFRRASDEDAELQAHRRYYSCAFLLDMEEHQYLVEMHAGKVEEILMDPGLWTTATSSSFGPVPRPDAGSGRRRRRRCTTASSRPRSRPT